MRAAYLLSGYLHFQHFTSPSLEWMDQQMADRGIDLSTYSDWTPAKITIWIAFLIGIIIAELNSHRFYISQTSEETKYPYKPQRCVISFWVGLALIWTYPDSRFLHFIFMCFIQRIVINQLCIIQIRMLSAKGMMIFAIPYCFGAIFRIIEFWYIAYLIILLVINLIIQGFKNLDIWKLLCALLYLISGGFYYRAISKGCETSLTISFATYVLVLFVFLKPYYDFMKPHLKANEELWKNRGYNLWK